MRSHPQNHDLMEKACTALASLLETEEKRAPIAQAGGVEVLISALKEHRRHPAVNHRACRALGLLASGNAVNQAAIEAAGGVMVCCFPLAVSLPTLPTLVLVQSLYTPSTTHLPTAPLSQVPHKPPLPTAHPFLLPLQYPHPSRTSCYQSSSYYHPSSRCRTSPRSPFPVVTFSFIFQVFAPPRPLVTLPPCHSPVPGQHPLFVSLNSVTPLGHPPFLVTPQSHTPNGHSSLTLILPTPTPVVHH